jgi:hypothetical protein
VVLAGAVTENQSSPCGFLVLSGPDCEPDQLNPSNLGSANPEGQVLLDRTRLIGTMKTNCTSRPDCPCDFCTALCTALRVKAFCYRRDREMDVERAEENRLAEDFLRSYSRKK